ncbi:MAG: hydrogenase formation protein HypD [Euryarchaeota archaeon]|nr:hydrogenase formation protein HypD [Euryarchaeota archaeon]
MFHLKDRTLAEKIVADIKERDMHLRFMHVCGTHQDTLVKHGLDSLFKECGIEIRQGPGCPVCVTTPKEIEKMLCLARDDKIVTSFGDMINVPGETESLRDLAGEGHDIRMVYSIEDAVKIADDNPERDVVFMAIGFETTAPTTASVMLTEVPSNFSILSCHRLIPPALKAVLDMGELKIDGFIEPGHVATIIGVAPYEFVSDGYGVPQVIAGFEPIDLLMAIWMLVQQIEQKKAAVENEYSRIVQHEGNIQALTVLEKVFTPVDSKWRGFPTIPNSKLSLKKKFEDHNAEKLFEDELQRIEEKEFAEPKGCRCGEVLRGLISSQECPLFGTRCVPSNPVGPCMVSAEGSCNIEYRYS